MRATGRLGVYLLVFLGLFGCASAWGQTNGEIRGTVNDPSGAVVPGATVTATLTGTDTTRGATSDKDGAFDIPELAVGNYDVAADAQGFKKFVAKNVIVSDRARQFHHRNVAARRWKPNGHRRSQCGPGRNHQHAARRGDDGHCHPRTSPECAGTPTRLLQLQPGVQSQLGADLFAGSDNAGVVSVNGGRGRSNNYMVNGGDGNDIFVNAPGDSTLARCHRGISRT